MKRTISSTVAAAVGLGLAVPLLAATPAEAAKVVNVKSKVTIDGYDASNINKIVFHGTVTVKKQKKQCLKKRKAVLRQVTDGKKAGTARTNKSGQWKVSFDGDKISPGDFRIKIAKKAVKAKGKKVVCKAVTRTYAFENIPNVS